MRSPLKAPGHIRAAVLFLVASLLLSIPLPAAETIPAELSDDEFRNLIETLSEPNGTFPGENYVSNEIKYADVIRDLRKKAGPEGVYIGVGPEQNFQYVAALKPKLAFIIDIRRQNTLEHLMYKAIFETSGTRAEFLARLFSRKQPPGLSQASSAVELLDAYGKSPQDSIAFRRNLREIDDLLSVKHGLHLTVADEATIEKIYKTFFDWGPATNYASDSEVGARIARGETTVFPTYAALMKAVDGSGTNWSYLASEGSYRIVRTMQLRNLIVPVTGDFGGPKTIRGIGKYLEEHGATVSAFYVSNVETYLFEGRPPAGVANGGWKNFMDNVSSLPLGASSVFIRYPKTETAGRLDSIQTNLRAAKAGRITKFHDLLRQ